MSRYDRSVSTGRVSRRDLMEPVHSGVSLGRSASTQRGGRHLSLQRPGMSHSFHHRAPQGSTRKFPLNDKNQRAHHSEHGHGTDSLSCRNRQLQQTRVNLKKKQPSSSASWRNFFTVRLKIPAVEADMKKDSRHHRKKPVSTKSVAAATEKTPAEQKTKPRAPPDARVFVASTKRETWHGETVRDGERTSTSTRPKSGASTIQEIHSYSSLHDKLSRLQDTRMSNGAPSVASTSENSSLTGYYSLTQSGHTHKSSYSIKSLPSVAENSLGSSSNMDFGDSVHDDEQSIWDDIETIVSCVSDREDYTGSDASDGSTSDKKEKGEGNYEAKLSDDDESDHDEINPAEMLAILTANIHFGGTTPMLSNEETAAVRKLTAQRRDSRKSRNSRRVNRRLSLPKVEALIEEEPQQETPMINKTQSVDAESMGSSSLYPTIDASEDELSDFDAVLEGFMGVDELTSYEKPQDLEGDTGTLQVTKKTKKKRSTKDKKEMTEEEKTARLQRRKERSQRKLKDGDTKEAKEKRSSSRKEGDGKKKKKKHRRHRSREARRESFRSAMSKIKESNGTKVDTETLRTLGTAFRGLANEIEVGTLSKDSVEGVAVTGFLEVLKSLTEEVQDDCTLLSESSTSARGA